MQDTGIETEEPKKLAAQLIIGKNRWLIKIRWFYSVFIICILALYNYATGLSVIKYRDIALIIVLSLLGNFIFLFAVKRHLKHSPEAVDCDALISLASLQLDFDLVTLSLLVFYSGGFDSPAIVFFIFYIMISTFLIYHKKAYRNTLTAMVLVLVLFFTNESVLESSRKLAGMLAFNVILFFSYFISAYLSRNLKENEEKIDRLLTKFREQSVTDRLTGLYNQMHFFFLINLQVDKAKRYGTPFGLLIFDVDNFKNYNDNNGHIAGSEALRRVGDIMRLSFRSSDMLCKYGGDEFVIILPNSDRVGTFLAAERLREMMETEKFEGGHLQPMKRVTVSLGLASFPEHGQTAKEILDKADKALYYAKETGRNRTVIYGDEVELSGK
ncbi:MAG: GGDEF domain-containing protein [bacterium]|nr:GGDEF domain-containing protein [bacterium]